MSEQQFLFLHVGCGIATQANTTPYLARNMWREVRLDIDPQTKPDIIASIVGLDSVQDESFDAVFSSHNIEHIYAHEVSIALKSFYRVLKKGGHLVISCPDIQSVAEHVAQGNLLQPLYTSVSGPIAAIDILYGFRPALQDGNFAMAHRCAFTMNVLLAELKTAGFGTAAGMRIPEQFILKAVATREKVSDEAIRELISRHFLAN
ncbi:class I SAM-dependent methyltransferase [Desulfovibrio sp. OttesenSCG-928-M14]|nr:class I SAM-dependent methyltransferase [Desulfovibrio sp. OttesenSCG-928-M14]